MKKYKFVAASSLLLVLTACSSSSTDSNSPGNADSLFPASFDHRVSSISFDYDKDGSIDRSVRYNYDENGRMIQRISENEEGAIDTTTFLYFDDDLIEIRSDGETEKYGYENGRVVSYEYLYAANEIYNEETFYYYDNNGRLTSVIGDNNFYYSDDCETALEFGETEQDPTELSITYANGRIANISSTDGVFSSTYSYNSSNQPIRIEDKYSCYDEPEVTLLQYNSEGTMVSREFISEFFSTKFEAVYDNNGKAIRTVNTDRDFPGAEPDSTTTDEYTYNEENLVISIDSTTVDPDPGFLVTPSYLATIEYESETCLTAPIVNPLSLATLTNFNIDIKRNDPSLCNLPL